MLFCGKKKQRTETKFYSFICKKVYLWWQFPGRFLHIYLYLHKTDNKNFLIRRTLMFILSLHRYYVYEWIIRNTASETQRAAHHGVAEYIIFMMMVWFGLKRPILHAYHRCLCGMNKLIHSGSPHFQSHHQEISLQLFSVALTIYVSMFQMLMLPWVMHRLSSSWHFATELHEKELQVYWNLKKLFWQAWNYSCFVCLAF